MRPDWTKPKINSEYNLSNNVCIDTQFVFPNINASSVNQYPDEYPIYNALSKYHNVPMENIAIGFGIGELIQRIYLNIDIGCTTVLNPTWAMSDVFLDIYKKPIRRIPYTNFNELDFDNVLDNTDTIYVANPNNVNGQILSNNQVKQLLTKYKLVILDEAYIEFSKNMSMVSELANYSNLLILRTLSKSLPCAGLRLGYCLGNKDIIQQLQLTRPSCVAHGVTVELVPRLLEQIPSHIDRMLETKQILINDYNGTDCHGNYILFNHKPNIQDNVLIKQVYDNIYRMSLFNKELLPKIFK